ncbi:MAG: hypothetical protein AB1846_11890 [Chloroflexota bacterium]
MPDDSRTYGWMWLALALMVILLLAFLLPLVPNDYWWYVRLGQDILAQKSVPVTETYSYTQFGQPIVYQSWLASALLWLVYDAGGLPLTFLLRGLALALTYGLLLKLIRETGTGPKAASLLILIAALAGSNNWSHRPQLLAYPLFAWTLWLLWRREQGTRSNPWWLVFIAWLWANLHGSFPLFFALTGAALAFGKGDRKQFALVFGASLLVTLLNPNGPDLWTSVAGTFLAPGSRNLSVEWGPPVNDNWQMGIFFFWLLIFPMIAALSTRRLTPLAWVWFIGFGWLALTGMRYVIWFLFILTALTAYLLAERSLRWLDRPRRGDLPAMNTLLAVIFVLLPLVALPGLRDLWWPEAPPPYADNTPVEAVEWLSGHDDLPGQLWSDIAFSSYLIFALPSRPVWIDTRFQVAYPPEQFDEYLALAEAAPSWPSLLDKYDINLLMLSPVKQPALIAALSVSADWCRVYGDPHAEIYARKYENTPCE